jgi:hypothetical protein
MVESDEVKAWQRLEPVGRIFIGAFGRNLASVAVNMFSRLIFLKKKKI